MRALPGVTLNFEAAVCSGIPIIHSLQTDYLGDSITRVMGIMNGTTNFMLSKMEDEVGDYGPVLKEAQAFGYGIDWINNVLILIHRYAEANPEADVEGLDVQVRCSVSLGLTL